MYDALADQVTTSVSLLSDLVSTTPPPEFHSLVYDQMCRPSWGWSFADFWAVVGYAIDHIYGENTHIPPTAGEGQGHCKSLDAWMVAAELRVEERMAKNIIAMLAAKWLEREEAMYMTDLADAVRRTLSLCET
jgi:hypothetical protein